MRKELAALALVLPLTAGLVCPKAADAGGFSITQFGSRRTGMLANMAAPDEVTALFHNPAGLSDQKGFRMHVSSSFAIINTGFQLQALDSKRFPEIDWAVDKDGYYEKNIEPTSTKGALPYIGVAQDLGPVSDSLRDVVLSMAVTAPNLYAGALPADAPSSYLFIKGHFAVISTIFGVGWRINDSLAVGFNLMYNYMQLRFAQNYSLADALGGKDKSKEPGTNATLAQSLLGDLRMDYSGQEHGVGWTFSLLYSPTRWLSAGLAYNDATDARFRGNVSLSPLKSNLTQQVFDDLVSSPAIGYRLPSELIVEMPIPPYISMGLNFHPLGWLEVGVDCRLWLYNVFNQQVIEPIYEPGTDDLKTPFTKEQLTRDKDYNLSWDLSLGFLVRPFSRLPELEFMFGGGFDKSPVPDENFTIDNPSMDNYRFSGGVRWAGEKGLRVALTYIYMGYLRRDVTTSVQWPPVNARGWGSNQTPRLELEYVF